MRVPCVFSTLWTIFSTPFARIWTSAVASCLWSNWMIGTVEKWAQIKANKQCYLFYKPLDEARVCHGCTSRQARPASDFTLPKLQESAGSASEFLLRGNIRFFACVIHLKICGSAIRRWASRAKLISQAIRDTSVVHLFNIFVHFISFLTVASYKSYKSYKYESYVTCTASFVKICQADAHSCTISWILMAWVARSPPSQ